MTFDYLSAKGKVTIGREVLIIEEPNPHYKAISLTDITSEDEQALAVKLHSARMAYEKAVAEAMAQHGARHEYRLFNPDSMANVKFTNAI